MRKIAIITTLLLTTTGARAEHLSFGMGVGSCATWLSTPSSESRGGSYVTGMWTGLNAANSTGRHTVGDTTDGFGIIAEVKKTCGEQPSMAFAEAIMRTYVRIEQRERPASR